MPGRVERDPVTGRIIGNKSRPLAERYPTSRKFCSSKHHRGPRWRHIADFAMKNDGQLQAWCRACLRIHMRKGDRPRPVQSQSRRNRLKREYYRTAIARIKSDPRKHLAYLEKVAEHQAERRRMAGVPPRPKPYRSNRRKLAAALRRQARRAPIRWEAPTHAEYRLAVGPMTNATGGLLRPMDRQEQRDAANECVHDRLPGDSTPPCGCWVEEARDDFDLTRHAIAQAYAVPPHLIGSKMNGTDQRQEQR